MVIFWIIGTLLVAGYGSDNGAGFWKSFLISIIFSPLLGFVFVLFVKDSSKNDLPHKTVQEVTPSFDQIYSIREQFPERFRNKFELKENEFFVRLQSDWIPKSKLGIPVKFERRLVSNNTLVKKNKPFCLLNVEGYLFKPKMPFDGIVEFNQSKGDWLLYNDILVKVIAHEEKSVWSSLNKLKVEVLPKHYLAPISILLLLILFSFNNFSGVSETTNLGIEENSASKETIVSKGVGIDRNKWYKELRSKHNSQSHNLDIGKWRDTTPYAEANVHIFKSGGSYRMRIEYDRGGSVVKQLSKSSSSGEIEFTYKSNFGEYLIIGKDEKLKWYDNDGLIGIYESIERKF